MPGECGMRTAWVLAALVISTIVLTIAYAVTQTTPEPASEATPISTTRTASATPAARALLPDGITGAVTAFIAAWSTQDPQARGHVLAETATAGLVEQLALTDASEVPDSCTAIGTPVVVDRTAGAVLVTVPTSCEPTLWLGLEQDTGAPHGWRVNAVGRERSWIS